MSPQKTCTRCGQIKDFAEFPVCRSKKSGINSHCKTCHASTGRISYKERKSLAETTEFASEKRCKKCRQTLPIGKFPLHPGAKDYHRSVCIDCHHQNKNEYYRRNTDKVKSYQRQYNTQNPEKVKARKREYDIENRNEVNARKRRYYATHREKMSACGKKYRLNHPEYSQVTVQRRLARKRKLPATFTAEEWNACLQYWKNCCAYCGRQNGIRRALAQDHFVPLSKGGPYTASNILPACHGVNGCNNSKANKDAAEWLAIKFDKPNEILARIEIYFDWVDQQNSNHD